MRQASTVLPRPTSSASSQRTGSARVARSATWSWCGKSRMRPPRNEPRPSASRADARWSAVEAQREVLDRIHVARGQPLAAARARPPATARRGWPPCRRRRRARSPSRSRSTRRLDAAGQAAHALAGPQLEGDEGGGVGGQPQARAGDRELDLQRAPRHRDHAPRPQRRVLAMPQPVAGLPHRDPRPTLPGAAPRAPAGGWNRASAAASSSRS